MANNLRHPVGRVLEYHDHGDLGHELFCHNLCVLEFLGSIFNQDLEV